MWYTTSNNIEKIFVVRIRERRPASLYANPIALITFVSLKSDVYTIKLLNIPLTAGFKWENIIKTGWVMTAILINQKN